jgi:hypothetical protein
MDAALIGALIGISIMVGFGIGMKIYDLYQERKKLKEAFITKKPLFVRRHSKMNTLFPK